MAQALYEYMIEKAKKSVPSLGTANLAQDMKSVPT